MQIRTLLAHSHKDLRTTGPDGIGLRLLVLVSKRLRLRGSEYRVECFFCHQPGWPFNTIWALLCLYMGVTGV